MNDVSSTDLVAIEPANALTVFTTPNAIDPILERVRKEIDGFTPDITTPTGRKAVASMAYRVARAKTYLDDAGKALADKQKEIPKKIDACRKHIRDTLDKWRDEVREPLTAWEIAEEQRTAGHKAAIARIVAMADVSGFAAAAIAERVAQLDGVAVGPSCEEFLGEYAVAKEDAGKALRSALAAREKYEAEQAELARLRAAEEARKQKEREEQIAREAAESARRAAEAKAASEAKVAEDAARRELELKLQAEQAERRAVEAEAKAKREAEQKAAHEAEEAAKREADKAHKSAVMTAALEALKAGGVDEASARLALTLILERKVPRVSVSF